MNQIFRTFANVLYALSIFTTSSLAFDLEKSQRCIVAISEALSYLSFAGSHSSSFIDNVCTNELRTFSLYAAASVYCDSVEIDNGLRLLDEECEKEGLVRIPYSSVEPILSDEYIASLRILEFREVNKGVALTDPVLISKDYFWRAYRTNEAWALATWSHRVFGNVAYWFWGVVLLAGMLNRFISCYFGYSVGNRRLDVEGQVAYSPESTTTKSALSPLRSAYHWIRTHFIIPAAIGTYRQRLFYWCSIPTRMEALVIALYYVISLILAMLVYDIFEGNLYWDDTFSQYWRYFSDRTGIMSYANLVILWLFGGRNNVFLWATGWSFSTFNLFHRAIARVATVQAIAHSIGYTVLALDTGTYTIYWPSAWWYMGAVATISMSLLLGFSSVWLRRNYYEIFLILHIALSIVALVGLFIHTSIFKGEYDHYLWPVVAVWSVDRFMRLVRLVACNLQVRLRTGDLVSTRSVAHYDIATDLIRLDICPGSFRVHPRPGQFYYLYQPVKWRFYESHPFTVASWSAPETREDALDVSPPEEFNTEIAPNDSHNGDKTGEKEFRAGGRLTFWIRPFNGWTRRLRSDCMASWNRTIDTTMLLEGPYGIHHELNRYENIMLVAGGTGIAAVLPHIGEYVRRTSPTFSTEMPDASHSTLSPSSDPLIDSDYRKTGSASNTKSITLVWTVRQEGFIHSLAAAELQPALSHGGIDFHFHTTGHRSLFSLTSISRAQPDETTRLLSPSPSAEPASLPQGIKVHPSRPDLDKIINNSLHSAHQNDTAAVLVCGPAEMADETRAIVHEALKRGHRLDYFEESFGW